CPGSGERMAMATTSLSRARPAKIRAEDSQQSFYASRSKRFLDLAIAIPLLVAAFPLITLLALLVIATSGWPAFYRGERMGRDGVPFRIWKLRSMVRGAEVRLDRWIQENPDFGEAYFQSFKLRDDPRITRFGSLLRKTSLDELPQLWNV